MSARHPLPYAFAKANTVLLEHDGGRLVLWAPSSVGASVMSEVTRLHTVDAVEMEDAVSLGQRIAAAYAGGESSAAAVVGEVESAVDLSRMMQELPAVEDLLEARTTPPSSACSMPCSPRPPRMARATSTSNPTSAARPCAFAWTARCAKW